ncbi:hypothetical protein GCM10010435_37050 [Winogradskya consettensis]|uniref:Uncharacterized protein n=2 Tax=Winogradskya TaxID=3240235 RepID=A0A919T2H5_9ACTN|nr:MULTISPECIES: hypothetical protein [Actinoplanes]GIE17706.1 hypothetical protein Ahu01nite_008080 [Actinoplanes humidus]GIM83949.1 hypothetical protein Aco04nite_89050 [Actinoplanes consettensis]
MTDHEGVLPDPEQDCTEDLPTLLAPEPADDFPHRMGCRTQLHGWAGAHLHGAVRPRRRAAGRGRPPGRWC